MCLTQAFVTGTAGVTSHRHAFPPRHTCTQSSASCRDLRRVVLHAVTRVSMLSNVYTSSQDGQRQTQAELDGTTNVSRLDAIRKQIEFWFSPSNLRRDWYLRRQMDENGWMDPAVFLKFNRIKQLNVSLAELIDACRRSDILEVSQPPEEVVSFGDDIRQTRIRLNAENPMVGFEESAAEAERSLVAESLPNHSTRETIRDIFLPYGEVTYTWLSKPTPKDPDVHAIICFDSPATASSALNSFVANPPEEAAHMTVTSKTFWDSVRAREKNSTVVVEVSGLSETVMWRDLWNEMNELIRHLDVTIVYFLYTNGDPTCYITLADDKSGKKLMEEVFASDRVIAGCKVTARVLSERTELEVYWQKASARMMEKKKRQDRFIQSEQQMSAEWMTSRRGLVISIDGLPAGCGWKRLLSELKDLGTVVFLSLQPEATKCYVRLKDAETAAMVVAQLNEPDPVLLLGTQVTAAVIDGAEESEYWRNAAQEAKKRKSEKKVFSEETTTHEDTIHNDFDVGAVNENHEHSIVQPEFAGGL